MYSPTKIFDNTVPVSEKNGNSEDAKVDISNNSLKDFKSGAIEFKTNEYEKIINIGKRFSIYAPPNLFISIIFLLFS